MLMILKKLATDKQSATTRTLAHWKYGNLRADWTVLQRVAAFTC